VKFNALRWECLLRGAFDMVTTEEQASANG